MKLTALLNLMEAAGFTRRELNGERVRSAVQHVIAKTQGETLWYQIRWKDTNKWSEPVNEEVAMSYLGSDNFDVRAIRGVILDSPTS